MSPAEVDGSLHMLGSRGQLRVSPSLEVRQILLDEMRPRAARGVARGPASEMSNTLFTPGTSGPSFLEVVGVEGRVVLLLLDSYF